MKKKSLLVSVLVLFISLLCVGIFVFFKNENRVYYVSSGCDMIAPASKQLLYRLNYQYCHFLRDGGLLAYNAGTRKIYRFDGRYNLKWSAPHHLHHEFYVDESTERLFTFGSANHEYQGRLTRFDTIKVINISNGALIQEWDLYSQNQEVTKAGFLKEDGRLSKGEQEFFQSPPYAAWEYSHFNSIHPIPPNNLEKLYPYLRPGNFLVSFNAENVYGVYSFEENKVIGFIQGVAPGPRDVGIHDVQFFDTESIVYYRNTSWRGTENVQIIRFNLKTKQREILYEGEFKSKLYGGIAKTQDGGILISYNDNGAKIIKLDLKKKKIVWEFRFGNPAFEVYRPRELELSTFLKNNYFLDPILTAR